ncbi:MAG: RNA polymerase sigma-70 factor [Mangrovibacterium sp.]
MAKTVNNELFAAVSSGDEGAFEKVYLLYFPRLYVFAIKIVQDEALAKDIVQSVFIKIWETKQTKEYEYSEALMFRMVRNASLNYIRHLKVVDNLKNHIKDQYLGEELYYIDMVGDEPYILIEYELQKKVMDVMNLLPDKCQLVFRMSRIDGFKNSEIAEQLGISIKAVEKQITKALSVYKQHFSGYLSLSVIVLILRNF